MPEIYIYRLKSYIPPNFVLFSSQLFFCNLRFPAKYFAYSLRLGTVRPVASAGADDRHRNSHQNSTILLHLSSTIYSQCCALLISDSKCF